MVAKKDHEERMLSSRGTSEWMELMIAKAGRKRNWINPRELEIARIGEVIQSTYPPNFASQAIHLRYRVSALGNLNEIDALRSESRLDT